MYILFDIGGTKTRIAQARSLDSYDAPIIFETPKSYEEGIKKIKETILGISQGQTIDAIAGGIAGPFSQKSRTLIQSLNLPDWVEKPLATDLETTFHTKVFLDNDSAMVGLGEAVYGAGRGFPIVAYVTVSTGVGGARIVDGSVDERSIGFEPGKQIIGENGETLEGLISGRAVEEKTGKKPAEIHDPAFWDTLAKTLAQGLNNVIVDWSPDVVVLGGSMMNNVGISVEKTMEYLKEILTIYPELPMMKKSELGDLGGLSGALAYLKQNR